MAILPNHWTELGRRHIDGPGENDRLFSSFFLGHSVADRVELQAVRNYAIFREVTSVLCQERSSQFSSVTSNRTLSSSEIQSDNQSINQASSSTFFLYGIHNVTDRHGKYNILFDSQTYFKTSPNRVEAVGQTAYWASELRDFCLKHDK
ncbi:hypothetical protein CDAR_474761 [Caerostris darwini]|uniref:Uncharacterized protein n=1 Tax=Caerostris darwini TaxID=1538125 RepID=A0AAV4MVA2_9ARAC|nr:hypothetical protein CDAR_474761 [Caerostris darwini]